VTQLLLRPATQNIGRQHAGKSRHHGHWEWCWVACRKIPTSCLSKMPKYLLENEVLMEGDGGGGGNA